MHLRSPVAERDNLLAFHAYLILKNLQLLEIASSSLREAHDKEVMANIVRIIKKIN